MKEKNKDRRPSETRSIVDQLPIPVRGSPTERVWMDGMAKKNRLACARRWSRLKKAKHLSGKGSNFQPPD